MNKLVKVGNHTFDTMNSFLGLGKCIYCNINFLSLNFKKSPLGNAEKCISDDEKIIKDILD